MGCGARLRSSSGDASTGDRGNRRWWGAGAPGWGLGHAGEGASPELKKCRGRVGNWDPLLGGEEQGDHWCGPGSSMGGVSERRRWLSTKGLHPQTLLPHQEEGEDPLG